MMFVNSLILTQFRNYQLKQFHFTKPIVAICGANGSGKTNLLDALYYLSFTKSYFAKPDSQSANTNFRGFRIESIIKNNEVENKLVCILRENNRKEFYLNDEPYKKFSAHIGRFPCVFIAPDDVQLITGNGESRRSFIDTIIAQIDNAYLQQLIHYKKILEERNGMLKAAAEKNYLDETLLNIINEQLSNNGQKIFAARQHFFQTFLPVVQDCYQYIAGKNDDISIEYFSQLSNVSFPELLQQNQQRDMYLQRTGAGIHKDDMEITMQQMPFKNIASQGQRKSLLFALKLAEFEIIKQNKGFAPILLLDDVFEKLDADRMDNLLHKVCVHENSQVFITDTHAERLENALKKLSVNYQLISL